MAFGSLDLTGTGIINIEGFLKSIIAKRVVENSKKTKTNTTKYNSFEIKH